MEHILRFQEASLFTRNVVLRAVMESVLPVGTVADSETLGVYCEAAMRSPRRYAGRMVTKSDRKTLGDLVESTLGLP